MNRIPPATQALWQAMAPTFEQIVAHPFITALGDGSLPPKTFAYYLIQDSLYLEEYGRCWALLGARSPEIEDLVTLTGKIASSLAAEQALQRELLEAFGLCHDELRSLAEPSPTCLGFTGFMKNACCSRDFADGFVAVMECPWAYWELGKVLARQGSPDPRYQKWIDGYVSTQMQEAVSSLHRIWERVATGLGPAGLESAALYARTAVRFDWLFWDAAYREERWPV